MPRQLFNRQSVYNAFVQVIKPEVFAREFGKFRFGVFPKLVP